MDNIRNSFHDIVNKLNKITVKTGFLVELSKGKDVDAMETEDLRQQYKRALEILSLTEKEALEAGKSIEILKKDILSQIEQDKEKDRYDKDINC